MGTTKPGSLYIVATPIGNLNDITLRAIEILKKVNRIVAEDTRHAGLLLKHFSIHKPTISLHEFNERKRADEVLSYLEKGENLALISDAGTPLINDPGFHLINLAKEFGIPVVPVPGPCALIAALSVAGMPTDRFTFEGFLPAKKKARHDHLVSVLNESRTMIFYEAPHRLLATLKSMFDVFGKERKVVITRELTKIHESIYTNNLDDMLEYFETHPSELRGEIVILVEGVDKKEVIGQELQPETVLNILLDELSLKQAASLASKITGERKNKLYEMALMRKSK